MNNDKLNTIHESILNGQRTQAYEQILDYGQEDFFNHYDYFIGTTYSDNTLRYYADAVKLFLSRYEPRQISHKLDNEIRQLWNRYNNLLDTPQYYDEIDKVKDSFKRLYSFDTSAKLMNKDSIIYLMRMNHALRIIPFHLFFINAEITRII